MAQNLPQTNPLINVLHDAFVTNKPDTPGKLSGRGKTGTPLKIMNWRSRGCTFPRCYFSAKAREENKEVVRFDFLYRLWWSGVRRCEYLETLQ